MMPEASLLVKKHRNYWIVKVGAFIFPDNHNNGMLEDLCLEAIASRPETECLDQFFACAGKNAGMEPGIPAKARVQAWLALQKHSDLKLGRAALRHCWPFDQSAFAGLKHFICQLFGECASA